MIPKIIHYCWFGGNCLDEKAEKCLQSWRKFFPDYEIIQWNESNFDVTKIDFMEKAYRNKEWAFVSDVARLMVVYEHGGIYFDTDVEVIRSYDDILSENPKAFMGIDNNGLVNTGLGFGAEKKHPILKKHIELYKRISFEEYSDHLSDIACPILTTSLLQPLGLLKENKKQFIADIEIFPTSYFAPIDYRTGKIKITDKTRSIHWYNASWQDSKTKKEQEQLRKLSAIFGVRLGETLYGTMSCVKREGAFHYVIHRIRKRFGRKAK